MIAVVDSGVGGLEFFHYLRKLGKENLLFYSDLENFPYGNKTEDEMIQILNNIFIKLTISKARIIILACNTISLIYSNNLEKFKKYSFEIFDMTILLKQFDLPDHIFLCTQLSYLLMQKYKFLKYAKPLPIPKLAQMIETNTVCEVDLFDLLRNYQNLVYACTHFGLIDDILTKLLKINIINPVYYYDYIPIEESKYNVFMPSEMQNKFHYWSSALQKNFKKFR